MSTLDDDYMPEEAPNAFEAENTTSNLNRTRESIRSRPTLPPAFESLVSAADKRSGAPRLNVATFIEIIFGCIGVPTSLFAPEEIEREDPSTILENISSRADEQELLLSPLTPLLASTLRSLHQRRAAKLAALKQKEAELSAVGLSRLTQDPGISGNFSDFLRMRDKTRKDDLDVVKMACGNKLKRYDGLKEKFLTYFIESVAPLDPSVILDDIGPVMFQWLGAMVQSTFRPARLAGTYILGCLGVALTERLSALQRDFHSNCEQLDAEKKNASSTGVVTKRTRLIKEQLKAADRLLSLVADVVTALKSRVDDVSWHIQYEAASFLGLMALRVPIWALMSNARWYVEVLDLIFGHEVVDMRLLAVEQVDPLLSSLREALNLHWPKDRSTDFDLDDSLIADQSIYRLQQKIEKQCPKLPEVSLRLNSLFDTLLQLTVKHVQDPDIRVATSAAEKLMCISIAEGLCKGKWEVALSDSSITSAVSLLFYTDCPVVRTEVARFVDNALFAHSVINEEEVKQLMVGEDPPMTPERIQRFSLQLCTLVEFFRDYATGATWVSRHVQAVRALWSLAPVLHHFDVLLGHLGLAFKSAPIGQSAELAQTLGGGALWCDEGSAGAMLSLVLAVLESQRTCLGGRSRYCYFTPLVSDVGLTAVDAERSLSEVSSGGYRLVPDDALWTFSNLEVEQRPMAKRCAGSMASLWRSIVGILHGARSETGQILVALSLAFELVDATDAILASLRHFRGEVDLTDLATQHERLCTTIMSLIRTQRSRASLKALFAVLMRLRDQRRRLEAAAVTQPTPQNDVALTRFEEFLDTQEKTVENFLDEIRKSLLEDVSAHVRLFNNREAVPEENADNLRGLVHLLTTLAENDVTNTFRHGLETLDDLITLLENKVKQIRTSETTASTPSHSLTVLIFDLLWVALARYMEQIAQRTETHLRETIFEPLRRSDTDFPPEFLQPEHAARVEERIRLFKEDLEIYTELRNQLLSFATECSESLRATLPQMAGTGQEEIEYTAQHKEALFLATGCVSTIINASYFRTLSPLWTRICRLFRYLLNHPVKVTLTDSAIDHCNRLLKLADGCGSAPEVEIVHEVALLADDLRLRSREHLKDMEALGLVSELPFPSLTMGLWPVNNAHPEINPSPYGISSLHHMYRNLRSERAVSEFLRGLPSLGELAETFHAQLAAAVCQLPDPALWRDSSLGLVILHGLSSRSLLSQRIGAAFIERLMLYERLQRQELIDVKVGDEEQAKPLLQELLLATIWAAINRYRDGKGVKHAQTIAKNSAGYITLYFQALDDQGVDDFVMRIVAYATTPQVCIKSVQELMRTVAIYLLGGRLKRRWKKEVAQNRLNAIYSAILVHCSRFAQDEEFLTGLKMLLRCCYFPASAKLIATPMNEA